MCHPVPNTVKAALDEALSALAVFKDLAPRLLDRLMQCAAVVPNAPIVPGVPRWVGHGAWGLARWRAHQVNAKVW